MEQAIVKKKMSGRLRNIHRSFSTFKSSITPESNSGRGTSQYGRLLFGSFVGSGIFFGLNNNDIQSKFSNFLNQNVCKDYYAVKETYRYYINEDLKSWPKVNPYKRLAAITINSFVIGFISGIIKLPMMVRIGMILFCCKYYNEQSPGFMICGLRGVAIENNEDKFGNNLVLRTEWRARMDYCNYIKRQFAYCPIELAIYIASLGSIGIAINLSLAVWLTHIAQFYISDENQTWLDKWANIQVIDLGVLQNSENSD